MQGICSTSIPNCSIQQNGVCTQCDSGFLLSNDQSVCYAQIANCQGYEQFNYTCTSCTSPFTLVQSKCVNQVTGCTNYSVDGFCTTC